MVTADAPYAQRTTSNTSTAAAPAARSPSIALIDPHDYICERAKDASKLCVRGKTSFVEIVKDGMDVIGYQSKVIRFIYQSLDLFGFRSLKGSQQQGVAVKGCGCRANIHYKAHSLSKSTLVSIVTDIGDIGQHNGVTLKGW